MFWSLKAFPKCGTTSVAFNLATKQFLFRIERGRNGDENFNSPHEWNEVLRTEQVILRPKSVGPLNLSREHSIESKVGMVLEQA